ncbi:MAG: GGDEF domain-containing protein [Polaromonas sp.]|nr:GGDEF domain-containing protein [Polaromonas sp.]
MEKLAIGFWGCYFGTTALMLAGSALAYGKSLHRISINAAVSALASAFFVIAFLGWLPIANPDHLARFLAHVASIASSLLVYLLLSMLGVLRSPGVRRYAALALAVLALTLLGVGWALKPLQALALSSSGTLFLGVLGFVVCLRSALRGDRLAWAAVVGVGCMMVAVAGLSWIALARGGAPWQVHAIAALAATVYLTAMASVLWVRYAYLVELHRVMAHGPSYDPVTRMRSHSETGQLVGEVFKSFREQPAPLGVIVLTIANLYSLEKLHGQSAVNHALFVCAGRLRRLVPGHVEMGRLGNDGFLLMMRNCSESGQLIHLAQAVQKRLSKSVVLNTGSASTMVEAGQTPWNAEIGVGVLLVSQPEIRGPAAIAMGRGMSRTAMSYASRIAWYDRISGQIAELSADPGI